MKRPDHIPAFVLTARALAQANLSWMPLGFVLARISLPPHQVPQAANEGTKP